MLRKAIPGDEKAAYGLICDMEQTELERAAFHEIFREQLESPAYCPLVYETEESGTVGFLNLRMESQLHHCGRIAEVMELAVAEGHRSRGIGRELFREACRQAKARGCMQIEVCCNRLRLDAHRFYEREGMKKYHFKLTMNLAGETAEENRLGL